jgi:hypothetical protein
VSDDNAQEVPLRPRSLAGTLRYLAGKLREGTDPEAIALTLDVLADQRDVRETGP